MQKEIFFYQEMALEHRLQENDRGQVPLLYVYCIPVDIIIDLIFCTDES